MAPFSHLSSRHFPLPLSTPPHHSPSALRSHSPLLTPFPIKLLSLLITPLTPIHTTPPYPTTSHYSPHYILSSLPSLPPLLLLTTPPHHIFSPTRFTTPLPTYIPHHTSSPHPGTPSPLTPTPHRSSPPLLKGASERQKTVKIYLAMSLNLCRTFLSLKTSFLIIFCKKKLGQNRPKVGIWRRRRARAKLCTCIVQRHRFIFPRAIFYLLKDPYFTFSSPFCEK